LTSPLFAAEYLPNVERREIVTPGIDTENFEISTFLSLLSVQNASLEPHFGMRLAYHAHELFFLEASLGQTDVNGALVQNLEDQRYTDYHLSMALNILPGQASLFGGRSLIHNTYLIAGGGVTNFAEQNNFTFNFGLGYRLLLNDNLAIRAETRDYIVTYDTPLPGTNTRQHNLAMSLGVSLFF